MSRAVKRGLAATGLCLSAVFAQPLTVTADTDCATNFLADSARCDAKVTPPRPAPPPPQQGEDLDEVPDSERTGFVNPCIYTSMASDAGFIFSVDSTDPNAVKVLYRIQCKWGTRFEWFLQRNNDPAGMGPPIVTPAMLLPDLYASVERVMPRPIPRVAPADWDDKGYAYVQVPVFFWVDQRQGQWATISGTAAVPGLSVTLQAAPEQLVVSTGDGGGVTCEGAPPAFSQGASPTTFDGCGYTYRDSSAMAENGETFPLQMSIIWHVTWSASNGEAGDLGTLTTTSDVRQLPVAEIQALIVDT